MKTTLLLAVLCFLTSDTRAAERLDIKALITEADTLTLLSISPSQLHEMDEHGNPTARDKQRERIHGYLVFGKISADDSRTRKTIQEALIHALDATPKDEAPLMCFEPRHAVCLKNGAVHVDLLISYECQQAKVRYLRPLADGEIVAEEKTIFIGLGGREALNRLLDAQKIERDIPKQMKRPNKAAP
jgi:hypothetical protein